MKFIFKICKESSDFGHLFNKYTKQRLPDSAKALVQFQIEPTGICKLIKYKHWANREPV